MQPATTPDAHRYILVVDDEPAHAEAVRRAFDAADLDFMVQEVGTLRGFRNCVAAHPPEIAIVDLNLPDGKAIEVLVSPPEDGDFPAIVITSFGEQQVAVAAMKAGALDYVVKSPEAFAAMPRTVERALRQWRALQERKRAEQALRESEERYRVLVATSLDAVLLSTPEGEILAANAAACRMFGYAEEELLRAGRDSIMDTTDPRLQAALEERARTGKFHGEVTMVRSDGTRFPAEISSTFFSLEGQLCGGWVIRDITGRKQAESRERLARETLELLNRPGDGEKTIRDMLAAIKNTMGFEAVAIRLRRGRRLSLLRDPGLSREVRAFRAVSVRAGPGGRNPAGRRGEAGAPMHVREHPPRTDRPGDAVLHRGGQFLVQWHHSNACLPPKRSARQSRATAAIGRDTNPLR